MIYIFRQGPNFRFNWPDKRKNLVIFGIKTDLI